MRAGGSRKTRIAEQGAALSGERRRLDGVRGESPPEDSWRYRNTGAPLALAWFGVAVGFVVAVVPGLFAIRSVRRWRDGITPTPALAWSLAVVGPAAAAIWAGMATTGADIGIVISAVLVVPAALVWVLKS
jgi:hypothetical protein